MEWLIPASESTPQVHYAPETGTLSLEGESYPEDVAEFFGQVKRWIDGNFQPGGDYRVILKLWYLNTGSTKSLLDILRLLAAKVDAGARVTVEWHYIADLELMREAGEELLEGCRVPWKIVPVEPE